ncbi:hypothetical protein EV102420_30_00250 [Pseudescherichia vulneris NBRC 102420]|uniref:Uncharacterized protein n=1 Tax=Pseudescherichia vulneris NBRC 102420 TaxID=1115515 RepID=A0A090V7N0_PSEVU|nr:hypothetical protein EV102420_30_00250 [Pseudescherichia vulneris NBRC 102420]
MQSRIFRLIRKVISEISGAVVISAVIIGVFIAIFANEGIMRVIAPVLVVIAGLVVYWLAWLISSKEDRR